MAKKSTRRDRQKSHPKTARQLAFHVLDLHKQSGEFASTLIEAAASKADIKNDDRALAVELAYGVIRRQRTLNTVLEHCVSRPRQRVEPQLWTLLQVGTFQLLFTRVAPHAAIFETVELAKWLGQPRWTGFMNGVLRNIQRLLTDEIATAPAENAIPRDGGTYRVLTDSIFESPVDKRMAYFGQAFSFPGWIAKKWSKRYPESDLWQLGFWMNSPTLVCLRVNGLKTTLEELKIAFAEANVSVNVVESSESQCVQLSESTSIPQLPGFAEGWFSVQDPSALAASLLLDPKAGERVLDLCAAPGTKTTHIAELMGNTGQIVACDDDANRLPRVRENCERLGVNIVTPMSVEELSHEDRFDAALVDVPCSNTGVLGKRPEVRWRLRREELSELAATQLAILKKASEHIEPGGRIVYSTCSVDPEENEDVVKRFLRDCPSWTLKQEVNHIPGKPADGAFQALLVLR